MAHPDLPASVKAFSAAPNMRWRHRYWHLVKNEQFVNDPGNAGLVAAIARIGWTSRLTGEPRAGLDFLFMHRMMIQAVDNELAKAGDPAWPRVAGWPEIPVDPDAADWPEPVIENLDEDSAWPDPRDLGAIRAIRQARSQNARDRNFRIAAQLRDRELLRRRRLSLDDYGFVIEVEVHNWMHMRFASAPPRDRDDVSPANDWLGNPFSSHVNPYFWKLHGWIDDCIGVWESALGETADFSDAWRPPAEAPPIDQLPSGIKTLMQPDTDAIKASIAAIPAFQASDELVARAESILGQ